MVACVFCFFLTQPFACWIHLKTVLAKQESSEQN